MNQRISAVSKVCDKTVLSYDLAPNIPPTNCI